ncbi:dTMP kinase [Allobranchiibius sp. GilTou38]|uniref:dTMP kinase n=1 Tax=Allobranchiibius sp. GilTou38 TaxID=2815210 RepID=UPI001AA1CF94|nr:dTMP kinase [Allobranchiibius sp. GilTou38]MBO1766118.1 dTMP kinase [Allobranchiibius sp. GilTou38]
MPTATAPFVVFEGGDGAGKTTQIEALRAWLAAGEQEVVVTREPGGTKLGLQLRDLLLHGDHVAPRAEALIFAADRAHHVETVVRPALARGAVVIADRYQDSSIAYQGAGRTLDAKEIAEVSRWATQGLVPDVTILLDLDPAVGLARRGPGGDRLEQEKADFHERVRAGFLALAAAASHRYLVVDATLPAEEVTALVRDRVAPMVECAP